MAIDINKNAQKIKTMFNEIAIYYDKMNNIISFGTHYIIKFLALKTLDIKPRTSILDICCGTGDLSKLITKFYPRSKVIGLDFSNNMIKVAKLKSPKNVYIQADCTDMPFKDDEFDYITAAFGLRNVEDREKAIKEVHRVLAPNGKFLHLDVDACSKLLLVYSYIVPLLAMLFRKNVEHYNYFQDSVLNFPKPSELVEEFEQAGFKHIRTDNYMFGIISSQVYEK